MNTASNQKVTEQLQRIESEAVIDMDFVHAMAGDNQPAPELKRQLNAETQIAIWCRE